MEKKQVGTCDRADFKQRKKDNREARTKLSQEQDDQQSAPMAVGVGVDDIEEVDDYEDVLDLDDRMDQDFTFRENKVQKDIMGPVTATADRLGLSIRQRCLFSASVANTLGVDIDNTNISQTSAWRKTHKERLRITRTINKDFPKPANLIGHWALGW